MKARIGLTAMILTMLTAARIQAAAPEIGAAQENACGIEGFTLTRIAQPVYGWWPGDLEYYEFAWKTGDITLEGVVVKPPLDEGARLPGVVLNHGGGGTARESGMEYGWQVAVRGFVGIACLYQSRPPQPAAQPAATPAGPDEATARRNEENLKRAEATIDLARQLPFVEQDRIYMYGHSMGAGVTISMVARSDKLKAAAFTASGMREEPTEENNPARDAKCPVLVMHGTEDASVDVTAGVRYYDELRRSGKDAKLIIFEGQPHRVHAYRAADVFDAATAWYIAHP